MVQKWHHSCTTIAYCKRRNPPRTPLQEEHSLLTDSKTVREPKFSWRVPTSKVGMLTYYLAIFCQKLNENERIWSPEGGACFWRSIGPANDNGYL